MEREKYYSTDRLMGKDNSLEFKETERSELLKLRNVGWKGLKLYLCEEECEADSGYGYELNIYISTEPCCQTIRERLTLSEDELVRLSRIEGWPHILNHELFIELYKMFGITNLESKPGYPKGPYFHINNEVYKGVYGK